MDSKKYIIVLDWVYNCIWVFGKIFMLQRKAVMSSVNLGENNQTFLT